MILPICMLGLTATCRRLGKNKSGLGGMWSTPDTITILIAIQFLDRSVTGYETVIQFLDRSVTGYGTAIQFLDHSVTGYGTYPIS